MKKTLFRSVLALCVFLATAGAWCWDRSVTGALYGLYESEGDILTYDTCTVERGQEARFFAWFDIVLKPGFHAKAGSSFEAVIADSDGLPNSWEMAYFGSLEWSLGDDNDGDGLPNGVEFEYGFNPADYNPDNDDDGLADWWELSYFGCFTPRGDQDYDGDGDSNYLEFMAGTSPANSESFPEPGSTLEYDEMGRLAHIIHVSESRASYVIEYSYDSVGNRTKKVVVAE